MLLSRPGGGSWGCVGPIETRSRVPDGMLDPAQPYELVTYSSDLDGAPPEARRLQAGSSLANSFNDFAGWTPLAGLDRSPRAGNRRIQGCAISVVEVVTFVVDDEVENGAFGERGGGVQLKPAVDDSRAETRHEPNSSTSPKQLHYSAEQPGAVSFRQACVSSPERGE